MKKVLLVSIILVSIFISSCENNNKIKPTQSAIEMMTVVFDGKHTEIEVKSKMDAVMKAYNIEITEENYQKCGSVFLNLKKSTGIDEIAIIDNMIIANTGKLIKFQDQAVYSVSVLEENKKTTN